MEKGIDGRHEIFVVPIADKFLLYAPLHDMLALIDQRGVQQIRQSLIERSAPLSNALSPLATQLRLQARPTPITNRGNLPRPLFLGIIPTRGCNMGCHYCDFAAPKHKSAVMSLEMAQSAIDSYFNLLQEIGVNRAEVQFFGGEPFYADKLIHFVVGYASMRAAQLDLTVRFEVTTNGLYSVSRCHWIADHFDTVVLSLDGPADIHDANRPALNGRGTFEVVSRSAAIFSESDVNLVIRSCITSNSVHLMPEMARWLGETFRPQMVCMEMLTYTPTSTSAGLEPPEPWSFGYYFDQASRILSEYGIRTVFATAEIDYNRATFCPVGQDALIVSPDGTINACYLLSNIWQERGLNMRLGQIDVPRSQIDVQSSALDRVRQHSIHNRSLCTNCICRFHCAGGCHVHHDTSGLPGSYDNLCIQTRLVTVSKLLHKLGQQDLVTDWFADSEALRATVLQRNDRLLAEEPTL